MNKVITTGLSSNEAYCLRMKGLTPGNIVVGNSVISLGIRGGIASGIKTLVGGEVTEVTEIIHRGRQAAYDRMMKEAQAHGGVGVTGVTNDLIFLPGAIEYLSVGSCVHQKDPSAEKILFSTAEDGQDLYCQLDAHFIPHRFVFGNVAYSIGLGGGVAGAIRGLRRGEVKEYSDIFNTTRHLALKRITDEARAIGANAVISVETSIIPIMGMQEMLMLGTAAKHPALPAGHPVVTSDLTGPDLWNAIQMGYMPLSIVLGASVYSIGFVGGISSMFKAMVKGEIQEITSLIYEARENALSKIEKDAANLGADMVLGTKTYVYQLGGGLIEFLAIGTAVKKMDGLTTKTEHLPAQAVVTTRDTFVNTADGADNALSSTASSTRPALGRFGSKGIVGIVFFVFYILFIILRVMFRN